jgi:hypothetical protein
LGSLNCADLRATFFDLDQFDGEQARLGFMRGPTGRIGAMRKRHNRVALHHRRRMRSQNQTTTGVSVGDDAHRVEAKTATDTDARGRCRNQAGDRKGHTMLRHVMIGLAAATLVGAMLAPDDAAARGGRGGGARMGAGGGARIGGYGGRAHVSRPIARPGVGYGGRYAGGRYGYGRYGYRGVGVGAAAVGAAAAGAYYNNGYYSNSCYRDSYGQLICPNGYQYGY